MSKVSKCLEARVTGNKRAYQEPLKFVTFEESYAELPSLPYLTEYRIVATLGAYGHAKDEQALDGLVKNVRHRLIEEIFGEFRMPLYELKAALYDRDYEKADGIAASIFSSMFLE